MFSAGVQALFGQKRGRGEGGDYGGRRSASGARTSGTKRRGGNAGGGSLEVRRGGRLWGIGAELGGQVKRRAKKTLAFAAIRAYFGANGLICL